MIINVLLISICAYSIGNLYGKHIAAAGFDPWLDSGREKTARFFETPAREGRVSWANRQTEA